MYLTPLSEFTLIMFFFIGVLRLLIFNIVI